MNKSELRERAIKILSSAGMNEDGMDDPSVDAAMEALSDGGTEQDAIQAARQVENA